VNTAVAVVDPNEPDREIIARAAGVVRAGGLVAFPTETVYGLGADAGNPAAVARIYNVKNRPADNPLIIHGNDIEAFAGLAALDETAHRLAEAFWPGPLTLVLKKKYAPRETVAVRVPSHPVARALIEASGCLLAAPSANTSGRPSPTRASHVAEDLLGRIEMILDGGAAQNGLESTVLDISHGAARLLRPGALAPEELRRVLPDLSHNETKSEDADIPPSPGMKYKHYAPDAPLTLVVARDCHRSAIYIRDIVNTMGAHGRIGVLCTAQTRSAYEGCDALVVSMGDRDEPRGIARDLFACLRRFNEENVSAIYAEGVEEDGVGLAVMNRLRKAAYKVVCVESAVRDPK
jgi:L-threonylcarbamoyladenylate synthase